MTPAEHETVAKVAYKLTGVRYHVVPMNPESWGWCVFDAENNIHMNGCGTIQSCVSYAARLNARLNRQ